jgi:hypothetical protein
MLHLPSERLAELADGLDGSDASGRSADAGARSEELSHLRVCESCTRELESYRRLVAVAADERLRIAPPLTNWASLSGALREASLLSPAVVPIAARSNRRALFRRAAAAIVLIGGGAVLGRATSNIHFGSSTLALGSENVSPASDGSDAFTPASEAQLVSNATDMFASPQAALASLERAQRTYEAAATYLATHDTTSLGSSTDQYRARLAALDRTAETMQAAMREAPQDPLINQYYLATMSAREQTLRRMGTVMPVGNRLGRF